MVADFVLSDDLARRINVLPGIVLAWAHEYRLRNPSGVMMMVPRKGERRCILSLPATIGMLAMAMPVRCRRPLRWVDLMAVACDTLEDLQALGEPVADPALSLLKAVLQLGADDRMMA